MSDLRYVINADDPVGTIRALRAEVVRRRSIHAAARHTTRLREAERRGYVEALDDLVRFLDLVTVEKIR